MTTAMIGTGGTGSVIARPLASGGETLRLSSAESLARAGVRDRFGLVAGSATGKNLGEQADAALTRAGNRWTPGHHHALLQRLRPPWRQAVSVCSRSSTGSQLESQ